MANALGLAVVEWFKFDNTNPAANSNTRKIKIKLKV